MYDELALVSTTRDVGGNKKTFARTYQGRLCTTPLLSAVAWNIYWTATVCCARLPRLSTLLSVNPLTLILG
jgi:hypothetical protein